MGEKTPSDTTKHNTQGQTAKHMLNTTRGGHMHPLFGTQRVSHKPGESLVRSDHGTIEPTAFALRNLNPPYLYQQFLILSHSASSRES